MPPLLWKKGEVALLKRLREEHPLGTATWKYVAYLFNQEVDESRQRSHWSLCWKYKSFQAEEEDRLRDAQLVQKPSPPPFHDSAPVSQNQQSNTASSYSTQGADSSTIMQPQPTYAPTVAANGQIGFPRHTYFQTESQTYYPGTSYHTHGTTVAAPSYTEEDRATPSQWTAIHQAWNQRRDNQTPYTGHQQPDDNDGF